MKHRLVAAAASLIVVTMAASTMAGAAQADGLQYALLTADPSDAQSTVRWNPCQEAITYQVNTRLAREQGRSPKQAAARAAREIRQAIQKVSAATGITFRYTGMTDHVPADDDWWSRETANSEIVIAYVNMRGSQRSRLLEGGAWAKGGQVYATAENIAVSGRGFVVIDRDKVKSMTSGFGSATTRGNVVLHELGHVMGLDHVDNPAMLMNPVVTDKSPNGFAPGDLAGLAAVGRAAGCIEGAQEFWDGS